MLLEQIGVNYRLLPVEADERRGRGEDAETYVQRIAVAKARHACRQPEYGDGLPIVAADTVVVVDGEILGKPRGRDDALAMLARLSGRAHEVLTAVAVTGPWDEVMLSRTRVMLRHITPAEAAAYWETGEPADKAGAYAIQGRGAVFVAGLEGSYSGVVGLPLFETAALLGRCGMDLLVGREEGEG